MMIFLACSIRRSRVTLIAPGAQVASQQVIDFLDKPLEKDSDSEVVRSPPHENFIGGNQNPQFL